MDREVSEEASKAGESAEIDAFWVATQAKKHRKLANPQKLMLLEMAGAGKGIECSQILGN